MRRRNLSCVHALIVVLLGACWLMPASAVAQAPQVPVTDTLSQEDLEELLGPIALYPDTLLANVMAACCYPDEVAKAAAYVKAKGDPAGIPNQGWEPSVQAVAKVPDALKVLAESPDWAAAIGQAYMVQSKDVMTAIQSLRAKAKKNGALASNKQQTIVEDGTTIIIEPAEPQVVYVPQYQPQVVYAPAPPPPPGPSTGAVVATGLISFGVGMAVGAALADNDCDWYGGGICHGNNDVDIDINRNVNVNRSVNVGDVNIDNSKTNVVNQNNIKNVSGNRVGNEGTAWKPNQQKVQAQGGTGKTDQLSKFKGASAGTQAASANIPGQDRGAAAKAAASRPKAGAARDTASRQPSSASPASGGDAGRARDAQASRLGGTSSPQTRSSPAARSSPDRKPTGFAPDGGSKGARDRGAASRTKAGAGGGKLGGKRGR